MSNNNAWFQTSTATPLRLQMSTTSMSTKAKRHDCCMSVCLSVTTNLSEVDLKVDSPEVGKTDANMVRTRLPHISLYINRTTVNNIP